MFFYNQLQVPRSHSKPAAQCKAELALKFPNQTTWRHVPFITLTSIHFWHWGCCQTCFALFLPADHYFFPGMCHKKKRNFPWCHRINRFLWCYQNHCFMCLETSQACLMVNVIANIPSQALWSWFYEKKYPSLLKFWIWNYYGT